MSEKMLSCKEVVALLTPYLDRELSAEETAQVKAHLDSCSHCASYFTFEASMLKLVREKLQESEMPKGLESQILKSLPEA